MVTKWLTFYVYLLYSYFPCYRRQKKSSAASRDFSTTGYLGTKILLHSLRRSNGWAWVHFICQYLWAYKCCGTKLHRNELVWTLPLKINYKSTANVFQVFIQYTSFLQSVDGKPSNNWHFLWSWQFCRLFVGMFTVVVKYLVLADHL